MKQRWSEIRDISLLHDHQRVGRRAFLAALGSLALTPAFATTTTLTRSPMVSGKCDFQLSVLTDEIGADFDKACGIAADELGLGFVDLRALWGKNIVDLDSGRIDEARAILKKHNLRVGCIAGPLFKVQFKGAPISSFVRKTDLATMNALFDRQDDILKRELELAEIFGARCIRCFDFLRLKDQEPYREAIDDKLRQAAEAAGRKDVVLLLENEHACNTATAAESVRTLKAVPSPSFKLIWDPGNAFFAGGKPFPDGYLLLPKDRIGLVHCKDARRSPDGKCEFAAMGKGEIDYVGQFRALKNDGFRGLVTLETHWKGAGSKEESTRQSFAGMVDQLREAGAIQ